MRGRKDSFCSGVPKRISVGATELIVRSGSGAPATWASSMKMCCSIGERPCPPYSWGQPMPSHPSAAIFRIAAFEASPPISRPCSASTSSVMSWRKYSRSSSRNASCSGLRPMCTDALLAPTGRRCRTWPPGTVPPCSTRPTSCGSRPRVSTTPTRPPRPSGSSCSGTWWSTVRPSTTSSGSGARAGCRRSAATSAAGAAARC